MTDSEITGPSSEPEPPAIVIGRVTAPVVRTAGQGGAAWAIMELIEAYEVYAFSNRQWAITLVIGTTVVSWIQNILESRMGKRLIGTTE